MRRKLAVVTPYGAEARFDNYAEFILAYTLRERGWDARMYTYAVHKDSAHRGDLEYMGVPVRRCRERLGFSPRLFVSLLLFRPDTIICFHPKNFLNFTAYLAARIIGARLVVEIVGILHDPYISSDTDNPQNNLKSPIILVTKLSQIVQEVMAGRIRGLWTNYIRHTPAAHADAVIAISEDEKKYIKQLYGRDSTRVYWSAARFIDHKEERPKVEIPEKFHFFMGQIKLRKGWDVAIDAIAELKKGGSTEHLVFVSPQKDLTEPTEYAKERGVLDQITFLVNISNEEKNWLYTHCTYVLIPSRYEGFGLIAFEAYLAKKPIIASNLIVFLEFMNDKQNVMFFDTGNGKQLAEKIKELDANPELREHLIQGGLKTAEDFNYKRMVDEHVAVIEGK